MNNDISYTYLKKITSNERYDSKFTHWKIKKQSNRYSFQSSWPHENISLNQKTCLCSKMFLIYLFLLLYMNMVPCIHCFDVKVRFYL